MKTLPQILAELAPTSRPALYRDLRRLRIHPVASRRMARGRPLALYPADTARRIRAHRNPTAAQPGKSQPAPRIKTLAQLRRLARNN